MYHISLLILIISKKSTINECPYKSTDMIDAKLRSIDNIQHCKMQEIWIPFHWKKQLEFIGIFKFWKHKQGVDFN